MATGANFVNQIEKSRQTILCQLFYESRFFSDEVSSNWMSQLLGSHVCLLKRGRTNIRMRNQIARNIAKNMMS